MLFDAEPAYSFFLHAKQLTCTRVLAILIGLASVVCASRSENSQSDKPNGHSESGV